MKIKQPVIGVGAVVLHDEKVLLVKRANPPNQFQWAIPGGKVHYGETLQQAVEREVREEAGIIIKAGKPIFGFDHIEQDNSGNIQCHYVIIDVRAEYISGDIAAGSDASEVKWFTQQDLFSIDNLNVTTRQLLQEIAFCSQSN